MSDFTPPEPPLRAAFLDIDGTLVGRDETIAPRDLRAIARARRLGCAVVLCTGRTRYRAEPVIQQLAPPRGYVVTSNGGMVMQVETGEIIHRHLLPIPVALAVINAIHALGGVPFVYEESATADVAGARVLHPPDARGVWITLPRYQPYPDLRENLPFAPISIGAFGLPAEMRPLARRLRPRLPAEVALVESGSNENWGLEIVANGISKRVGVQAVAARLGLDRSEILAIGDHLNDVEMLEWAGVGVAMGNAMPEALAAADWTTDTLENNGVALALERFLPAPKPAS